MIAVGNSIIQLLTQAWRLATWIVILRGRRGTYGTGLALVARSVPTCPGGRRGFLRGRRGAWRHPSSFHVAGGVLGDIHLRFTWQAWYNYSRRRGAWRHGSSLCVAGVARMALGWLWWRARFPRAPVVAAAFCVAGVALGDIHLRFTWQAWYLVTSTFVSRGRRGTITHAGVALGDMDRHFAWQVWHVWHWAGSGGALGSTRLKNCACHAKWRWTRLKLGYRVVLFLTFLFHCHCCHLAR